MNRISPNANAFTSRSYKNTNLLGQIGTLTTRLAETDIEIEAAQRLRSRVFSEDFAQATHQNTLTDCDKFDAICDHLLVLDESLAGSVEDKIIGTYRFLPQARAQREGGFYTDGEFALSTLIAKHPKRNFLELGRSCVLNPGHNSKCGMQL